MSGTRSFSSRSPAKSGEPLSARRFNDLERKVESLYGIGSTQIIHRNGRIGIDSGSALFDTWTYMGYRFKTSTILTIKVRSAIFHSVAFVGNVAQQDVLLSGSVAWVYVEIDRHAATGATCPVRVASARPGSDQTYLNWALYRFDLIGSRYALGHCGMWDLNVDNPVANT